jgi:hypothetical protein
MPNTSAFSKIFKLSFLTSLLYDCVVFILHFPILKQRKEEKGMQYFNLLTA